jgi:hypothetical protein
MQLICPTRLDAEEYVATDAHLHMRRPASCPHCRKQKVLRALGFYARSVTVASSSRLASIKVRRFRCLQCKRTVSMLPSFAQPYRLVCNITIGRFFDGQSLKTESLRWDYLLCRYWRRFNNWLPDLISIVGRVPGLPMPESTTKGSWRALTEAYGKFDRTTQILVRQFRITAFGRYRCHGPDPPQN